MSHGSVGFHHIAVNNPCIYLLVIHLVKVWSKTLPSCSQLMHCRYMDACKPGFHPSNAIMTKKKFSPRKSNTLNFTVRKFNCADLIK